MTTHESANEVLRDLSSDDLAPLRPYLQHVSYERGDVLAEVGEPAPYLYFPLAGVLSLVGVTESGATVEVAVVGREGMASVSSALGGLSLPYRLLTKVGGSAVRVPSAVIARQLRECGDLHQRVLVCTDNIIAQISQSAVCNRFHNARQRLARWLLMTADRAGRDSLPLTHEFISSMVGGPRSAVTEASAELRDSGAIEYGRGVIEIRDRDRLMAESCECYSAVSEAAPMLARN